MRDIGDKFLPPPLGRFERIDHRVERAGEVVDLARIFRRFLDAHAEFTPAKAARGVGHLAERTDLHPRQERRGQHRHDQNCDRHVEEQRRRTEHEILRLRHRRGNQHIADLLAVAREQRLPGEIARLVVDAGEGRLLVPAAVLLDLGQQHGIDGLPDVITGELLTGTNTDHAVCIAEQRLRIADLGEQGQADVEIKIILQIADGVVCLGQLGHGLCVADHGLLVLRLDRAQHQEPERHARDEQAQQEQRRDHRKLPAERCFHGYRTSNLYPTPQTVFRLHWSLTPSSFSRRRLTWTSTVRLSPK